MVDSKWSVWSGLFKSCLFKVVDSKWSIWSGIFKVVYLKWSIWSGLFKVVYLKWYFQTGFVKMVDSKWSTQSGLFKICLFIWSIQHGLFKMVYYSKWSIPNSKWSVLNRVFFYRQDFLSHIVPFSRVAESAREHDLAKTRWKSTSSENGNGNAEWNKPLCAIKVKACRYVCTGGGGGRRLWRRLF